MGKKSLIKRIENISIGVFIISFILLVIFLNSKAIDEDLKGQFLSIFAVELVFLLIFTFAPNWKNNADMDEILAVDQPLDTGFLETAKRIALRQSIIKSVIFIGIILVIVVGIISIQTKNMSILILSRYFIIPLFVILETFELYIDLKMHRVKTQLIPEEVQKIKPRVQKQVLFINYIRDLLVNIYLVIGGYQMSLSQVDEWTLPMYDKYFQVMDLKFGVIVLIFISMIWEWVLKHQDSKEPEEN